MLSNNKNTNHGTSAQQPQQSDKVRMNQQQILEEFKRRQQQFSSKNGVKEVEKKDKMKQIHGEIEQEPLICNICSESFIKRRIFYISCYIQLDNYYKSYQGLKKDIKQQHNYYLTTCNHTMHKDCVIQHIRTSNLYEQLLQENEYFCQCCYRLSNIFVPYLEQYEKHIHFKYNPQKYIFFIDEPTISSNNEQDDSFDEENQQLGDLDHGIITAQLPKNPQLPLPLTQQKSNKNKKKCAIEQKKKSHAVNYFNFPKVQNSDDQSFLQIIQQIEGGADKNGFGNENSPQKLLEKNMDFQRTEKAYRESFQQEINLHLNSLKNQIEKHKNKKGKKDEVVEESPEDVQNQGVPYLMKKKCDGKPNQNKSKQGSNKDSKKNKKQAGNNNNMDINSEEGLKKQDRNEQERLNRLLNQMQQLQYNEEMIIVEEKKESSMQEEERVLTDYFEPEVDISYLEDMNLRLQHIDIKYNNILICFQSLLINQIEESIINSSEIQDFIILKESFINSKQFNVSRNLLLYLKVWSFIEDRDQIHENYYFNQRQFIEDIQHNDLFIYEVALGNKSNFAAVLINLAILLLNKEEAFLSISAKFIYKYLIYDIIISKAKNLNNLDIIPDPESFRREINEDILNQFKEVVDYRFIQIAYCIWLIYYGRKSANQIDHFINSMVSNNTSHNLQNSIMKQDSQMIDDHTFVIFLPSATNNNNNILFPENTMMNSTVYYQNKQKQIASPSDIIHELLTQKVLDDLFFIPIYKKVTQFKNYKKFQLQLTLNLQQSYSDFVQCHFFSKCSICRRYPHINQEGYYMCLLCSSNFCAKHQANPCLKKLRNYQQNNEQHQSQQKFYNNTLIEHTQQHHSGMSMFLNYSSSQIVIIKDSEIYIERQLQLYKDRIGRPPNVNRDWKSQVSICINTQKELQDLINKKDFDQKCMQIRRILFDQKYEQQQQQLRRQLMNQENQIQNNQNVVQNQNNRQQQNRQNNRPAQATQVRQGNLQQRVIMNTSQSNQQQDSLSLNQQQDTQTVDLNQRRVAQRNASSNASTQNLNLQGINNPNTNNNNNIINNNQLYTNQQNFSSNIFTTLNF